MKPMRPLLLSASLGLVLGLGGCLDSTAPASLLNAQTEVGGVSFRLSSSEILVLRESVDSIRIEASRQGYPTRSASGTLEGVTRLSDLEAGIWSLKVALFDSSRAIRWAGDTTVDVQSGGTTDAVVRLRKATGSVHVRIVLDSSTAPIAGTLDTMEVQEANWGNQPTWGVIKAWRTAQGIFLRANNPNCAFLPKVRLASRTMECTPGGYCGTAMPIPDSTGLVLDGQSDPLIDCFYPGAFRDTVTHFVPWTRRGPVTLHATSGIVVLADPRNTEQEPTDSGFVSYVYSISGFMPVHTTYTLESSGLVKQVTTSRLGIGPDTTPATSFGILSKDSLAIALRILQSAAIRHSAGLPDTTTGECPTDAPFYGRKIRYANNTFAELSWSFSNYCGVLPEAYQTLNRVDRMLEAAFEATTPQILPVPARPVVD